MPAESGPAVTVLDRFGLKEKLVRHSNAVIALSVPAVLLSLAVMVLLRRAGVDEHAGIDYQVYRWAVHTWLSGGDIMHGAPMTSAERLLPWVYPPFALLPLAPLALLPHVAGLFTLYAVDLAAIGAALYLVARHAWPHLGRRAALAVASALLPWTLFLEPVYASFGLGQINIALMGLAAMDCLARAPRWPRGLLVGIAAAIKLTPAAFLLFFLVRKDFRAAVTGVVTAAGCTVLGFLLSFPASLDYWFGSGPANGVSGSAFHTNQSIAGALARSELPHSLRTAVWAVLCVVVVLLAAYAIARVEPPLAVVANALVALLVSPTSWSDHWVWCVPAILVMLACAVRERSAGWLAAGVVTALAVLTASFRWMPSGGPWTPVQHLVGNPYLLLGVVLLLLLVRCARRSRVQASEVSEPAVASIMAGAR
ncbi:glycosyltransferase family 87 protein [Saccharopolyspora erythraea]|uniref:glycosyltransferase family 87 protein n=1 Tax=Saccharopolyspora erythraea TaxID=1836 RepID=UPI003D809688